jgi:hypothetical protein
MAETTVDPRGELQQLIGQQNYAAAQAAAALNLSRKMSDQLSSLNMSIGKVTAGINRMDANLVQISNFQKATNMNVGKLAASVDRLHNTIKDVMNDKNTALGTSLLSAKLTTFAKKQDDTNKILSDILRGSQRSNYDIVESKLEEKGVNHHLELMSTSLTSIDATLKRIEGKGGLGGSPATGGSIIPTVATTAATVGAMAMLKKFGSRLPAIGGVITGVDELLQSGDPGKAFVKGGGAWVGAMGGAKFGAGLGAMLGPWGALAGGAIGGVAGGLAGGGLMGTLWDAPENYNKGMARQNAVGPRNGRSHSNDIVVPQQRMMNPNGSSSPPMSSAKELLRENSSEGTFIVQEINGQKVYMFNGEVINEQLFNETYFMLLGKPSPFDNRMKKSSALKTRFGSVPSYSGVQTASSQSSQYFPSSSGFATRDALEQQQAQIESSAKGMTSNDIIYQAADVLYKASNIKFEASNIQFLGAVSGGGGGGGPGGGGPGGGGNMMPDGSTSASGPGGMYDGPTVPTGRSELTRGSTSASGPGGMFGGQNTPQGDYQSSTSATGPGGMFGGKDNKSSGTGTGNLKGKEKLMKQVYDSFINAGYSPAQAKALTAEVGRENDFNPKNVFGRHVDANNGEVNTGFFSWQKSRGKELDAFMRSKGLVDKNGNIIQGQEALNAMAEFSKMEIETNPEYARTKKGFLNNPNISQSEAAKVLGKNYIRWDMDGKKINPYPHMMKRDGYYNQIGGIVDSMSASSTPDGVPIQSATGGARVKESYGPGRPGRPNQGIRDIGQVAASAAGMDDITYTSGKGDWISPKARQNGQTFTYHSTGNALDAIGFESEAQKIAFIENAVASGANGIGVYGDGSVHIDTGKFRSWGQAKNKKYQDAIARGMERRKNGDIPGQIMPTKEQVDNAGKSSVPKPRPKPSLDGLNAAGSATGKSIIDIAGGDRSKGVPSLGYGNFKWGGPENTAMENIMTDRARGRLGYPADTGVTSSPVLSGATEMRNPTQRAYDPNNPSWSGAGVPLIGSSADFGNRMALDSVIENPISYPYGSDAKIENNTRSMAAVQRQQTMSQHQVRVNDGKVEQRKRENDRMTKAILSKEGPGPKNPKTEKKDLHSPLVRHNDWYKNWSATI